ncbi:MAG: hypothetical protein L0Z73_07415 [Gammaproteobacteria bacterium]|nr:hypothetical protein [Gammaproteobacteria bacterium]
MRLPAITLKKPILVLVTCYSILLALAANSESAPPDAPQLQQRMLELIDYVDSPEYQSVSTWYEHVVLAYNLALGRNPEVLEAVLLTELHHSIGLPRSAVLSVALRGKQFSPSWARIRGFINKVNKRDFVPDPAIRNEAKKLQTIPKTQIRQLLNNYLTQYAVPPAADNQPLL